MSTFSSESLGTTQRARHLDVMMMVPMRPEMIRKAHYSESSFTERKINGAKRQRQSLLTPKNRYAEPVF